MSHSVRMFLLRSLCWTALLLASLTAFGHHLTELFEVQLLVPSLIKPFERCFNLSARICHNFTFSTCPLPVSCSDFCKPLEIPKIIENERTFVASPSSEFQTKIYVVIWVVLIFLSESCNFTLRESPDLILFWIQIYLWLIICKIKKNSFTFTW